MILRTCRGLEWVTAAEARGLLGARIERVEHREVWAAADVPVAAWLTLRTVDDALVPAGTASGLDHTRAALGRLADAAREVDWPRAWRAAERPVGAFDVVASFLGRRNFNRFEIEEAVGAVVADQTGARQLVRRADRPLTEAAAATVRVHLVDERASFSVRLGDRPLHRRPWKQADHPGTLRPPIAAALALLAGVGSDTVLLDPCAGAGTIVIEAGLLGQGSAVAGDVSAAAVAATVANAGRAAVGLPSSSSVMQADAGRLPLAAGSVGRVVTNVPWERTVARAGALADGPGPFASEVSRVLGADGRAVLLVADDAAAQVAAAMSAAGLPCGLRVPIAVSGARSVVVVVTRPGGSAVDGGGLHGRELAEELSRI